MTKEEIYNKNRGLIFKAIKDTHCEINNQDDFNEYFEAGEMGLISAINKYDDSTNTSSSYFYTSIKYAITIHFYYKSRNKRKINYLNNLSLDYDLNGTDYYQNIKDENCDIEKDLIYNEKIEILNDAIKMLKPSYQDLIKNLYGIKKPKINEKEYAKICNVSRQCINEKRNNALKKLKENYIKLGGTFYD